MRRANTLAQLGPTPLPPPPQLASVPAAALTPPATRCSTPPPLALAPQLASDPASRRNLAPELRAEVDRLQNAMKAKRAGKAKAADVSGLTAHPLRNPSAVQRVVQASRPSRSRCHAPRATHATTLKMPRCCYATDA